VLRINIVVQAAKSGTITMPKSTHRVLLRVISRSCSDRRREILGDGFHVNPVFRDAGQIHRGRLGDHPAASGPLRSKRPHPPAVAVNQLPVQHKFNEVANGFESLMLATMTIPPAAASRKEMHQRLAVGSDK